MAQSTDWDRMRDITPQHYIAYHTTDEITVDGKLDESAWAKVDWSANFVDIEGPTHQTPRHRTRVKMRWNDQGLIIAAELVEPHLWATITQHDAVMFHDNDFEVFLDPDADRHEYGELELNAHNATWDLFLRRPYCDGGGVDNQWEIEGLETAVQLQGTLNDPTDTDRGWTIEILLPWSGLKRIRGHQAPVDGTSWRINFSRVQWDLEIVDGAYRKIAGRREHNWVWSPQGLIDMHRPERWGWLQFSTATPGTAAPKVDATWAVRESLVEAYYLQREFIRSNGYPARSMQALNFPLPTTAANAVSVSWNHPRQHHQAVWITPDGDTRIFRLQRGGKLTELPPYDRERIEEEVDTMLKRQRDAWNAGNLNDFLGYYEKSSDTTLQSGGQTYYGYWRIEERYRLKYAQDSNMGRLDLPTLQIEPLDGEHCVVRGTWILTPVDASSQQGTFTLLLRRSNDAWRIIHDHTS